MIFPLSYYILKLPYSLIRRFLIKFRKEKQIVFFCDSYLDYVVFENIMKFLPEVKIVAKNRKVKDELISYGIESLLWPVFPDVVIMARHALHRFPDSKILKIGMRHGAYHFKRFINPEKYNSFDLFLLTSEYEVKEARQIGITSAQSGGFPKLDSFWLPETDGKVEKLREKLCFDNDKPIILFSATWEGSGMSAVDRWYDKLAELTEKFNVMVTLHPFINDKYSSVIKSTPDVFFIEDKKIYLYLKLADLLIGDTSSIIAEFCALDKPIITFSVRESKRLTPEIVQLLDEISHKIDRYNELEKNIVFALKNPKEKSDFRRKYNKIMFDELDGEHGKMAAGKIKKIIESLNR